MVSTTPAIVVMGVSGCGKSTIGSALAERLGCPFLEGDDFHSSENKVKMGDGIPLNDHDRKGWIMAIRDALERDSNPVIVSCSALKQKYRYFFSELRRPVVYIHLTGDRSLLEKRIENRSGHFFDSKLLDSQIETLELPSDDELAVSIEISDTIENIVNSCVHGLKAYLPTSPR
ncbi:MAG: gluconate kinase [Opitutae bacterium]|nr:gluconate kinase [Opitutae bacterium]